MMAAGDAPKWRTKKNLDFSLRYNSFIVDRRRDGLYKIFPFYRGFDSSILLQVDEKFFYIFQPFAGCGFQVANLQIWKVPDNHLSGAPT
jgi:hypothetical protein